MGRRFFTMGSDSCEMRLEYGREGSFGRNAAIGEVKHVDHFLSQS